MTESTRWGFRTLQMLTLGIAISLAVSAWAQAGAASGQQAPATGKPDKSTAESQAPTSTSVHSDDTYVIGANDVLAINVWKEADVSKTLPVRSDGKISLP